MRYRKIAQKVIIYLDTGIVLSPDMSNIFGLNAEKGRIFGRYGGTFY